MDNNKRVSTTDVFVNEIKHAAVISPESQYSFISTDFWKNLNLRPVMRSCNDYGDDILGAATVYFCVDRSDKEVKEEVYVSLSAKHPLVLGHEVLQKLKVNLTFTEGKIKLEKATKAKEANLKLFCQYCKKDNHTKYNCLKLKRKKQRKN